MPKPGKQPQDRRPKDAAQRLHDEATDPMETLLGREITIEGRAGSVTVTILDDPLDWEADVAEILAGWQRAGGIIVADVIPLLKKIVSLSDAAKIEAAKPTQRTARDLVAVLTGEDTGDDSGEPSPGDELGESQAS